MASTRRLPCASWRLAVERLPPSIQRRPATVTGGQTTGTAQLAATASSSFTPERASNASTSPVRASTAVTRSSRSGQSRASPRSRPTVSSTSDSGPVRARSAVRPSRAIERPGSREPRAAQRKRAVWPVVTGRRTASAPDSWRSYSSAAGVPQRRRAPKTAPAEVPIRTSAVSGSTPASVRPASIPVSQAPPTGPPPPSTSALSGTAPPLPCPRQTPQSGITPRFTGRNLPASRGALPV